MELRKDYAGIVDAHVGGLSDIACERIELVALACQELADRPPRELTDAEIDDAAFTAGYPRGSILLRQFGRAIEAAAHAKQREPQVVKFRAASEKYTGCIKMFAELPNEEWEWLDADGKAQEFEVRI